MHRQKRAYLANRPCPDHLYEAKDRSDALLQELQELIECMLHVATPDGTNSVAALPLSDILQLPGTKNCSSH
jgi:hypothetical protein